MQRLKNFVGNILGYGKCPVTGDTYWRTEVAVVNYSTKSGVCVLTRALREIPAEQIAQVALERGKTGHSFGERLFNLDEIMKQLPNRCFVFPRR